MNNYEIIKIQGFDKDGEPEIKKFQDGHIELQFNFMPPLNGKADTEDSEFWDNFEQTLQSHLNVNVLRFAKGGVKISKPPLGSLSRSCFSTSHFFVI